MTSRGNIDLERIRAATLRYVAGNQCPESEIGACSYVAGGPPLVYASAYAALVRHLCGDLETLAPSERREWAAYLLRYQCEDGLFRDPTIDCEQAESIDWWGWRHMTLHVLMARICSGRHG